MALGSARPEIVKYEGKYNVLTRKDSYLMLMITHDTEPAQLFGIDRSTSYSSYLTFLPVTTVLPSLSDRLPLSLGSNNPYSRTLRSDRQPFIGCRSLPTYEP